MEPGRYLVADSTILLTGVNSVKEAHRRFVNVDAGFNLLIRPVMYGAYHGVMVANKADRPPAHRYTIAGPICETGDLLAEDRDLPAVEAGDLIAVLDTGAYGFAMSSQYNGRPRCAEVLVRGTAMPPSCEGERRWTISPPPRSDLPGRHPVDPRDPV